MARSPQTLDVEDRRLLASWAADCAELVLPIFDAGVPGDDRPREAIQLARAFAAGSMAVDEAIRRRGGEAGAAARDAPTPPATAAAYAAEQAAAVAHMGAHALGAAGYAGKASMLAAERPGPDVLEAVVRRSAAAVTPAIAATLAALPPLGEDRSGPLGPGRLTSRYVGETIRGIQAKVLPARVRGRRT